MAKKKVHAGFCICDNKGFQITFDNDVILSTQFGPSNYCANYNDKFEPNTKPQSCPNAEVAAFYYNTVSRDWCTREVFKRAKLKSPKDDVAGYVSPEDWLKIVKACAKLKPQSGGAK